MALVVIALMGAIITGHFFVKADNERISMQNSMGDFELVEMINADQIMLGDTIQIDDCIYLVLSMTDEDDIVLRVEAQSGEDASDIDNLITLDPHQTVILL